MSSNSVTYRNQKPLGPAYIGENAADARSGQKKSKMSATLTSRSVEARGDEMAVSCIKVSKNQGYKTAGKRLASPPCAVGSAALGEAFTSSLRASS